MITEQIKKYIDTSVLRWLATTNDQNEPIVSPKEMFTDWDVKTLLIANIASPMRVSNIKANPNLCVSFVEVFVQKGFKLKGTAKIINKSHADYFEKLKKLTEVYSDKFPVKSIIEIAIARGGPILAPGYHLNPNVTAKSQIENGLSIYRVKKME